MTSSAPPGHRIVVGVDGSDSSRYALQWAAQQAETAGCSLEAVIAWEWPLSLGRGMPLSLAYDPAADATTILDDAIDDVVRLHPCLVIHSKVVEGHLVRALTVASEGADLVVVGADTHDKAFGLGGGRVTAHSLARAHCPVAIVREDPQAPKSSPSGDARHASGSTTGWTV